MKKKILSFILSAAMAITGIGVGVWEPVTVYAEQAEDASEPETFYGIVIDENGDLNPWVNEEDPSESGDDNNKYFKITGSGAETKYQEVNSNEEYNFHYDKNSHILTLQNMNVSISAGSVITSEYGRNSKTDKLTINLIGDNTLTTTDEANTKLATTSSTGGLILALKRADCIHA